MKNRSFYLIIISGLLASCQTSNSDCIDSSKIRKDAICTLQYDPVCGCDGKTYGNACAADNAGVTRYVKGECAGK